MSCYTSPFGKIYFSTGSEWLTSISWIDNQNPATGSRDLSLEKLVSEQLDAYFKDPAFIFDLPLAPASSNFSEKIREYLKSIPSGKTQTYGQIAEALSSSARAVGMACGRNPFAIVIPCHRVLAKNSLGGYYGTSNAKLLAIKEQLLSFEKNP